MNSKEFKCGISTAFYQKRSKINYDLVSFWSKQVFASMRSSCVLSCHYVPVYLCLSAIFSLRLKPANRLRGLSGYQAKSCESWAQNTFQFAKTHAKCIYKTENKLGGRKLEELNFLPRKILALEKWQDDKTRNWGGASLDTRVLGGSEWIELWQSTTRRATGGGGTEEGEEGRGKQRKGNWSGWRKDGEREGEIQSWKAEEGMGRGRECAKSCSWRRLKENEGEWTNE